VLQKTRFESEFQQKFSAEIRFALVFILENGEIEWMDLEEQFCKFMRPISFTHLMSKSQIQPVELITLGSVRIPVQILDCFYGKTKPRTATKSEWFNDIMNFVRFYYARGPDGKHYEMRPSVNAFEDFVIFQEVTIPPKDVEKLFHDYYNGKCQCT
jgi:hypothetical protein